jgi:hypothetical protein
VTAEEQEQRRRLNWVIAHCNEVITGAMKARERAQAALDKLREVSSQ